MKSHNDSWSVLEGTGRPLVTLLHLRDRFVLPVGGEVPRLVPDVEPDGSTHATAVAADVEAAWNAAWNAVETTDHTDLSMTSTEWLVTLPHTEAIRELLQADAGDADAWIENRKLKEMNALRHSADIRDDARVRRSYVHHIVERAESEIGKPLATFDLRIQVLPVEGVWFRQPSSTRILMSEILRNSEDDLARKLLPVIKNLGQ